MPVANKFLRSLLSLLPNKFVYLVGVELSAKSNAHRQQLLKRHGSGLQLADSAFIMCPNYVAFGDDCRINEFVHILGGGSLTCGDGVWIANHASIVTSTHPTDVEFIGDHPQIDMPVCVEDNVWIGSHAVILPGVTLGRSCVVGAGSVVTHDVPAYAIVGGVPAKIIRYKNDGVLKVEA